MESSAVFDEVAIEQDVDLSASVGELPNGPDYQKDLDDRCMSASMHTFGDHLFNLKISSPSKSVGASHFVYHVIFEGLQPPFKIETFNSVRRFSDFLGLHARLVDTYISKGVVIPPPPNKDLLGTTRAKVAKDSSFENKFLERRRVALERFLTRILNHPVLRDDPEVLRFIEYSKDLPQSVNTKIVSSASAKKLLKNVGDAFGKMTHNVDDPEEIFHADEYFRLKAEELDSWELQLTRLHDALRALTSSTLDFSNANVAASASFLQLANVEEHTGLVQSLNRLAETEENVAHRYTEIVDAELTHLVGCALDTLGIIRACKDTLDERHRKLRNCHSIEVALNNKKDQKYALERESMRDLKKIDAYTAEIQQLTDRLDTETKAIEQMSKTIKVEFARVDMVRFLEFQNSALTFLDLLLQNQENILRSWEAYLVKTKTMC